MSTGGTAHDLYLASQTADLITRVARVEAVERRIVDIAMTGETKYFYTSVVVRDVDFDEMRGRGFLIVLQTPSGGASPDALTWKISWAPQ